MCFEKSKLGNGTGRGKWYNGPGKWESAQDQSDGNRVTEKKKNSRDIHRQNNQDFFIGVVRSQKGITSNTSIASLGKQLVDRVISWRARTLIKVALAVHAIEHET